MILSSSTNQWENMLRGKYQSKGAKASFLFKQDQHIKDISKLSQWGQATGKIFCTHIDLVLTQMTLELNLTKEILVDLN